MVVRVARRVFLLVTFCRSSTPPLSRLHSHTALAPPPGCALPILIVANDRDALHLLVHVLLRDQARRRGAVQNQESRRCDGREPGDDGDVGRSLEGIANWSAKERVGWSHVHRNGVQRALLLKEDTL